MLTFFNKRKAHSEEKKNIPRKPGHGNLLQTFYTYPYLICFQQQKIQSID